MSYNERKLVINVYDEKYTYERILPVLDRGYLNAYERVRTVFDVFKLLFL